MTGMKIALMSKMDCQKKAEFKSWLVITLKSAKLQEETNRLIANQTLFSKIFRPLKNTSTPRNKLKMEVKRQEIAKNVMF